MKLKHVSLYVLLLLLVIFASTVEVNAMQTGFSTEELSEEAKTEFMSNINVLPISTEPGKKGVVCFDVNEQGMIAVGQRDSQAKRICVYNSRGEFLYGYAFDCSQGFLVEWDEINVNLYFLRSDVIISLDSCGNILDVRRVQNTIDNNSYRNSLLYSTTRSVDDITYLIRNDMGMLNWIAPSFSQIVTIDASGTEVVIYDVNSMQLTRMIIAVCFICVFVFVAVVVISRQFLKFRHSN